MMTFISVYEFDKFIVQTGFSDLEKNVHVIPETTFRWLEEQSLRLSESRLARWVRPSQYRGKRAIQITSYAGVVRAPDGFQIEILPKIGKINGEELQSQRHLLVEMLRCLQGFRNIHIGSAKTTSAEMNLLDIFISEFLRCVGFVVKRGLRSDFLLKTDNLQVLRGKLLVSKHLQLNVVRADRFFTEHDSFERDRPENRLIHSALRAALLLSSSTENTRLARELLRFFLDIPTSNNPEIDFKCVRIDRSMLYYEEALGWAQLILTRHSPVPQIGFNDSPSLLFPMESIFEAFVAKCISENLPGDCSLRIKPKGQSMVSHRGQDWFLLEPDLLFRKNLKTRMILDTKWKLLDNLKANRREKYGLSQSDLYQLQAYGQNYLDGCGDVVLIYPKTDAFDAPLDVFEFPKIPELRLWVLPFCVKEKRLIVPKVESFCDFCDVTK